MKNKKLTLKKLTLKKLKEMDGGLIFAKGFITGDILGLNPELKLKWCACRGKSYFDWCIYYHLETHPDNYIKRYGDKIFDNKIIKKLVPYNKYAWGMYRF